MRWKKLREESAPVNHTMALLPHSQKKPIYLKVPVWVFGTFFLMIMTLVSGVLFFAGSTYRLHRVEFEKQQVELEQQKISEQKQQIEDEGEDLKPAREQQERELEQLEQKAVDTMTELKKLISRESEIRGRIGLDTVSLDDPSGLEEDTSLQVASNDGDVNTAQKNLGMPHAGMPGQYQNYDALTGGIAGYQKEQFRQDAVDYILQLAGNPYVYGGTDPNTGADCPGFIRYVISHAAGASLNRTAAQQSKTDPGISESDVESGDLVFYGSGSYASHVAIYIDNGKAVHAPSERTGIKVPSWKYRTPMKIVNVLGD